MCCVQFQQIKSQAALYEVVDKSQLTSEFGGTLSYNHHDWVRFRMVRGELVGTTILLRESSFWWRLARGFLTQPLPPVLIPHVVSVSCLCVVVWCVCVYINYDSLL